MSKHKEVSKDSESDRRGGFTAPAAGIEEQKKRDLQRVAGLLDNTSPAFLNALLQLVSQAAGKEWQIKTIIEGIDRVYGPGDVASVLPVWEELLGRKETG